MDWKTTKRKGIRLFLNKLLWLGKFNLELTSLGWSTVTLVSSNCLQNSSDYQEVLDM